MLSNQALRASVDFLWLALIIAFFCVGIAHAQTGSGLTGKYYDTDSFGTADETGAEALLNKAHVEGLGGSGYIADITSNGGTRDEGTTYAVLAKLYSGSSMPDLIMTPVAADLARFNYDGLPTQK